jgi:hypothetical protein
VKPMRAAFTSVTRSTAGSACRRWRVGRATAASAREPPSCPAAARLRTRVAEGAPFPVRQIGEVPREDEGLGMPVIAPRMGKTEGSDAGRLLARFRPDRQWRCTEREARIGSLYQAHLFG